MLPDVSGETVIRAIRELHPDLPIIVLTGLSFEEAEAKAKGANEILNKPCSMESILAAIENALPL